MEYDENNLEKMNIKTDVLDHRIVTAICTFHKRTAYRERAFLYPFERILTTPVSLLHNVMIVARCY